MITIDFSPLFPWAVLITLGVLSAILLGYGILRRLGELPGAQQH